MSKLSNRDIARIIKQRLKGKPVVEIARDFQVTRQQVYQLLIQFKQERRYPERAGSDALHSSGQRARAALGGAGLPQSAIRTRCRAVVLEDIPGAVRRPDYGGDCVMEVSDRDLGMEDADGDIVPGVFSFCEDPVCGGCWG